MKFHTKSARPYRHCLCLLLSLPMAAGPSTAALAQTNAAAQAVRQRVQGLGGRGEPESAPTTPPTARDELSLDDPLPVDPTAVKTDTTYVAPEAVAIVVLRPAQLLAAPIAQMLPVEVATAAGLQYLGFDPAEVDEVVAFAQAPGKMLEYGLAIKFNTPFKGSAIPANLRGHAKPGDLDGRKYLQSGNPMLPSLYAPDAKTLVVAPDTTLRRLVATKDQPKSGPVVDRVLAAPPGNDLYAAINVAAIRPVIAASLMQAAQQMPPDAPQEIQQFFEAPSLISAAELTCNLSATGPMSLVLHANDDASAEKLAAMVDSGMKLYQTQLQSQMAAQAASGDPIQQALAQYTQRMSSQWADTFRPTREGATLTFFKTDGEAAAQQQLTQVAIIGILVALLLPAVQAAREAARRTQSMNNLRQLMLALLNYESARKTLPAHAIYSAEGQPLLSWRVQILPYLDGGQNLYRQFKLDEPWDSEHNQKLIAQMPAVFQSPNMPLQAGKTNLLAVVSEPCMMNGTNEGIGIRAVTDGTSNTIMLVEADPDQAVEWTKPDDWEYDPNNPSAGLGGLRPNGWNAGFTDGSIQFISNTIDPETLKAYFTRAGGEAVQRP